MFYVRAFSDAAQKKWGQDSKDVTGTIKAKAPDYADSTFVDEPAEKKSPGFEGNINDERNNNRGALPPCCFFLINSEFQ